MPRYVYLLSTYDEDGAQNVRATLHREDLLGVLEVYRFDDAEFIEAQRTLADLLARPDAELASVDGHNLQRGWGGIQFHVVGLEGEE